MTKKADGGFREWLENSRVCPFNVAVPGEIKSLLIIFLDGMHTSHLHGHDTQAIEGALPRSKRETDKIRPLFDFPAFMFTFKFASVFYFLENNELNSTLGKSSDVKLSQNARDPFSCRR